MRVLHVINTLGAGGAEVFVAQLAEAMAQSCTVSVWTYRGPVDVKGKRLEDEMERAGVRVGAAPERARRWNSLVPLALARFMREFRPDVVNAHLENSELAAAMAVLTIQVRPVMVRTVHCVVQGLWLSRVLRPIVNRVYDYNIACGEAVLNAAALSLPPGRSLVVRNGIKVNGGSAAESEVRALRAKLGLPADKLVFMNIGRMAPNRQKAQDVIIEAFAREGLRGRADLVLVGDGPDRPALQALAASLRLERNVHFAGQVADVTPYLALADVVLMPSRFEGLPIVAIECACAGRPLVVSDIEELRPFKGRGSVICRPADAGDLARAMRLALDELSSLREAASLAAADYRSGFGIDAVARRYLSVYETLLRQRMADAKRGSALMLEP